MADKDAEHGWQPLELPRTPDGGVLLDGMVFYANADGSQSVVTPDGEFRLGGPGGIGSLRKIDGIWQRV